MPQRTCLITGVSSGFGRHLTEQLLARGDRVVGTVLDLGKVTDPRERYRDTFHAELLDVTDTGAIREVVERSFAQLERIDVIISIEGFVESLAQEVAPFGIGVTIVEPGGARTEFRYGSAQVAKLMPAHEGTPAHGLLRMLDPKQALAPGDPARMATRSSRASTRTLRRCAWCWARRRWRAPLRRCASGSLTYKHRLTSPDLRISRVGGVTSLRVMAPAVLAMSGR